MHNIASDIPAYNQFPTAASYSPPPLFPLESRPDPWSLWSVEVKAIVNGSDTLNYSCCYSTRWGVANVRNGTGLPSQTGEKMSKLLRPPRISVLVPTRKAFSLLQWKSDIFCTAYENYPQLCSILYFKTVLCLDTLERASVWKGSKPEHIYC